MQDHGSPVCLFCKGHICCNILVPALWDLATPLQRAGCWSLGRRMVAAPAEKEYSGKGQMCLHRTIKWVNGSSWGAPAWNVKFKQPQSFSTTRTFDSDTFLRGWKKIFTPLLIGFMCIYLRDPPRLIRDYHCFSQLSLLPPLLILQLSYLLSISWDWWSFTTCLP